MGRHFAIPLLALAALGACSQHKSPTAPAATAGAATKASTGELAAASEAFEQLTEGAFGADKAKVDALVKAADQAGHAAIASLPQAEDNTLSAKLDAIGAAHASGNAADLAIASNEAYRAAVTAIGGQRKVPVEVSLLDYAGFRITADLKANPERWADTKQALTFALLQWTSVKDKVPSPKVAAQFGTTLDGLGKAIDARDKVQAMKQVTQELDEVDLLEQAFAPPAAPN